MYVDVCVKILAVLYSGEYSDEGIEFAEVSTKTFCGVERKLEAKLSDKNTRLPMVVLLGDPQSIEYLSAGLN